jgi:hypothetical protein
MILRHCYFYVTNPTLNLALCKTPFWLPQKIRPLSLFCEPLLPAFTKYQVASGILARAASAAPKESVMILKQAMAVVGTSFAIAVCFAVAAPKTVRAVVASLVQVNNTVGAPAITEGVPKLASQNVTLYCQLTRLMNCYPETPGQGVTTLNPYTVPAGQNLVITEIEITSGGGGGAPASFTISAPSSEFGIADNWNVNDDGLTHEFHFSNGLVFPAGSSISVGAYDVPLVMMRGYLTAN